MHQGIATALRSPRQDLASRLDETVIHAICRAIGQPLWSLEIILGWIRGTKVGGVGVTASLDLGTYPTKIKVSNAEMKRLDLEKHGFCLAWNYTISPH